MAVTYWHANYWHANYWHADYWTEDSIGVTGDYWHLNYWHSNYWHANYWAEGDSGAIFQSAAGVRTLSPFNPMIGTGPSIQATTPTLSLTALNTATANNYSFEATLPTRTLTSFNPQVDNAGYQQGDVSFTVFASSNIGWTDTVSATAPDRTLTAPFHAVDTGTNVTINVQQSPNRTLVSLPHSVTNNVSLTLIAPVKQLTGFNVTTGTGLVISASLPTRTVTARQPNLVAVGQISNINVSAPIRALTALELEVDAFPPTVPVPDRTYPIDQIPNANATTGPTNYEICERTGFRVKPGELVEEWNGVMVRQRSFEHRHPQDFVRSSSEKLEGSKRPEQDDRFVSDLYPTGVSASDL